MGIYLGVNSGTSADAVDCVAIQITANNFECLGVWEFTFSTALQNTLIAAGDSPALTVREYRALEQLLHQEYLQAVKAVQNELGSPITSIGIHGQTLQHYPDDKVAYTLQCVDGVRLAKFTGIDTIYDFRSADIALGGQGAPLMPAFLSFLYEQTQSQQRAVFINLGGIANITYCEVMAGKVMTKGWDVGPANALLDIWVQRHLQQSYDALGQWASSGKVCQPLLQQMLSDPYFARTPPKSTHRDYFNLAWIEKYSKQTMIKPEDVQATLVQLSVQTIAAAISPLMCPSMPVYLYGKGYKNIEMYRNLQQSLPGCRVYTTAALGLSPEAVEGGLFAWLAYCYRENKAVDLTKISGASKPCVLGVMARA